MSHQTKLDLAKENSRRFYEEWISNAVEANKKFGGSLFKEVDPKDMDGHNNLYSHKRRECFIIEGPKAKDKGISYDVVFGYYKSGEPLLHLVAKYGGEFLSSSPKLEMGIPVTDKNQKKLRMVLNYKLKEIKRSNAALLPYYEITVLPTITQVKR